MAPPGNQAVNGENKSQPVVSEETGLLNSNKYMGFRIVTLCFAEVIVGGMGNLRGTAFASYALCMVMVVTAWFWGAAADTMIFAVMAVVLIFRPIEL